MVGIIGYGAYIPRYRIRVEEIAKIWGVDAESYKRGLGLLEKSVPSPDQDTITMAVEATKRALIRAGIDPRDIGACYVGSESHPYAVKPSSTVLAEAIGATPDIHIASFEFACKAGTEAIYVVYSLVKAGEIRYGLAVGSDTSQGAPSDPLEYSTAAGAASFIIGRENVIASIDHTYSFTTDTPDFWRRPYQPYPRHGVRFTGEPAYFRHITSCARRLMEIAKMKPEDFRYVVFHQPNGKFPLKVGKRLGFKPEQIEPGLLCPRIGNTYSGSSPLGLTSVLDIAEPGDKILLVSFGSGAGSDGFIFTVQDRIREVRGMAESTEDFITRNIKHIDYGTYAKFRGKILMGEG